MAWHHRGLSLHWPAPCKFAMQTLQCDIQHGGWLCTRVRRFLQLQWDPCHYPSCFRDMYKGGILCIRGNMKAVYACSCNRIFLAIVKGLAPTLVISHPFRLMMGKNLSRRAILFIYEFPPAYCVWGLSLGANIVCDWKEYIFTITEAIKKKKT